MGFKKIEAQQVINTCRACGSTNTINLDLTKEYYLQALDVIAKVTYAGCSECGLIFQAKYFGDEWLKNYYKKSPMLRRLGSTSFEEDQYERQASFIFKYRDIRKLKVLEIGAGSGGFLMYLHQKCACRSYFDEFSDEATSVLFDQGGLTPDSSNEKKYDLIILRHVLEHVDNIHEFLAKILNKINKNGTLFIEVPDWSLFDAETDPLIFEHLSQFTLKSLMNFFMNNLWSVDAVEKSICKTDPASPNRVLRLLVSPPSKVTNLGFELSNRFKNYYVPIYRDLHNDIKNLFEEHPGHIALYPASHLSFTMILENQVPREKLVGLFDIDKKKQGKDFLGFKIYPPEKLIEIQPNLILITTMGYEDEIKEYLSSLPLNSNFLSLKDLMKSPENEV